MHKQLALTAWNSGVSGSKLVILLCLAPTTTEEGVVSYCVSDLAKVCGISPRQVARIMRDLEERGFLEMTEFSRGRRPRGYKVGKLVSDTM